MICPRCHRETTPRPWLGSLRCMEGGMNPCGMELGRLDSKPRKQREGPIRKRILDWLNDQPGVFAWRTETAFATVGQKLVPGIAGFGYGQRMDEGKRTFIGTRGQQDIMACVSGWLLCVETKAPNGRQSEAQRKHQERVEAAGGVYVIAKSIDDVRPVVEALRARRVA